ncbi:lysozyme inhibitor LprI family protein [Saccharicrinis sp. FJH2]|uniref:lysozyme inhibitor LprI family protein n=1 Tax=Saccharicrinis sp. FJH65 TaxID=3344659 RepID=UPI0035F4433D
MHLFRNTLTSIMIMLFLLAFAQSTKSQTQAEMNQEAFDSFAEADSVLNVIYQQIFIEYANDRTFLENLKKSQRLWIKFRDAEMEARFPMDERSHYYGSMFPMCYAAIKKSLTEDRIRQLRVWIDGLPETEGCTGSVTKIKEEE